MSYYSALSFALKDGTIIPIEPVNESYGICSPSETIDLTIAQWNKFANKKYYCTCCHGQLDQWEVNETFRAYFMMQKKGKTRFRCFYCFNSCYETCKKKTMKKDEYY